MTNKQAYAGLPARLLQIRGTQFTPIENELVTEAAEAISSLLKRVGELEAELEHFIDIVDGTADTGFDPHVEQMLMDAAETARAALNSDAPLSIGSQSIEGERAK